MSTSRVWMAVDDDDDDDARGGRDEDPGTADLATRMSARECSPAVLTRWRFLPEGARLADGAGGRLDIDREGGRGDSREMASSAMSGGGSRFWVLEGVAGRSRGAGLTGSGFDLGWGFGCGRCGGGGSCVDETGVREGSGNEEEEGSRVKDGVNVREELTTTRRGLMTG